MPLWRPCLHRLRDRVAHHEPLLGEDLAARYSDAVHLAGLISTHLQAYMTAHSTGTTLLQQRPAAR